MAIEPPTPRRHRPRLLIGTSGFVYPHWRQRFYPRGLPTQQWLAYYAQHFDTVELNNPFYRLPTAELFGRWRRAVPPGFVFAVKASRYLTHIRRLRAPAAPLALLLRRARRLEGTIGPVLFQLPGQFHLDLARLDGFLASLGRQSLVRGLRAVLEVRHPSWLIPEVRERLARAGVALCVSDWRDVQVDDAVSADFVYVRRHGSATPHGRYSETALGADARRIRRWLADGRDVYVYFNNDARAHAVENARRLATLLRVRSVGKPGITPGKSFVTSRTGRRRKQSHIAVRAPVANTLQTWSTVPSQKESRCALVLAGGEGSRLRELTRRVAGDDRPKQFCPLLGGETLLEQTLQRVGRQIPADTVRVVLQRDHEPYYAPLLAELPESSLVVQPVNRGTAPAVLYGLLRLGTANLAGPVAIFPSDHYVSDDERFMAHIDRAFQVIRARPDLVVLLGVPPETPEPEFGWIEPGEELAGPWPGLVRRVRRFWEKPHLGLAQDLMKAGCLWNSFVLIAYPFTLLTLVRQALPSMVDGFIRLRPRLNSVWEPDAIRRLYSRLSPTDFSTHILGGRPANLAVLTLHGVGWSDLGRPGRVLAVLAHSGATPAWADRASA